MFDITKLALKIPNFLTHAECDGLINEYNQRENEAGLESSGNSKTGKIESSSFTVVPLNPYTTNFNLVRKKTKLAIDSWINYLDQPNYFFTSQLKKNLRFSHNYRIMKYGTGAKIHPHSDWAPYIIGSISFNLNNNYEGGEFKFFNGNYTVSLDKGDALIFPADNFWVHEVSPVTKGERYSLNSFLTSIPENVRNTSYLLSNTLLEETLSKTHPEELLGPYNN